MSSPTVEGDEFAPITSSIGFLRAPLDVVGDALERWRREIHGSADHVPLSGGLREGVGRLEPLTGGGVMPRELLISTSNPEWTALLDCGLQGGDHSLTISYLAEVLTVAGVVVVSIPDAPGDGATPPRYGARQLEMFSPVRTDFMNYVRTISVVNDWGRWRFDANGLIQDFEDVSAYSRRKVADRFTGQMLIDYCADLGLHPFDEGFFCGPSRLVTNSSHPLAGSMVLTLRQVQERYGIHPR